MESSIFLCFFPRFFHVSQPFPFFYGFPQGFGFPIISYDFPRIFSRLQDRHQLEALQSETESLIEALESLLGEGFGRKWMWWFPKIWVPQNGWFLVDIPIKMDDLGVPLFQDTTMWFYSWVAMDVPF